MLFFSLVERLYCATSLRSLDGEFVFSAGGSLKLDHAAVTTCVSPLGTIGADSPDCLERFAFLGD